MQLFLDRSDGRSLAVQLYDQVREAILSGQLPPGSRLQPTRSVAHELGVARSTVTDAYARLTAAGYVEGHRGGGSVVLSGHLTQPMPGRRAATLTPRAEVQTIRRYGDDLTIRARYDLSAGRVDGRLFPIADWLSCMRRALAGQAGRFGGYGDPAGGESLRRQIAQWVGQSRGVAATPEQIVVTNGTGHAVDLVARSLLRPGDVAVVEEPGYPPVIELLRTQGITVIGVPVDHDGLVVEAIPDQAKLVHVTPSHQYPLGSVLSRDRRLALLHWAPRRGAVIIEDDYDSEFRYTPRPLEPLHRLDTSGHVIYVGTFSKILSPQLRVGFAVLPGELAGTVATIRQAIDVCPSPMITEALATFIEEGNLGRHLRRARRTYTERREALLAALDSVAARGITPEPSRAGLHLTVRIPDDQSDHTVAVRAARHGLLLSSLGRTYQFSEPRNGLVLGFGAIATSDIPHAIDILAGCLQPR